MSPLSVGLLELTRFNGTFGLWAPAAPRSSF
jgi:hypothetical protein